MQKNRIVISAGGTGGHLYPAQALGYQLLNQGKNIELLFVGGKLSSSPYFNRQKFNCREISCSTFGQGILGYWQGSKAIFKGILECRKIIKDFGPKVVIGFGSYHTLPMLIAAKLSSIPIVLHEGNRIPGKVNRVFSSCSELTIVHFPDTLDYIKGRGEVAKMPLREGFCKGRVTKEESRLYFRLHPSRETLLIFGGSQGAKSLNYLICKSIIDHLKDVFCQWQVIHLTGDTQLAAKIQEKYNNEGIRACVKDFEDRMDLAWRAADVMISRSGASTIAEQIEMEVPGILIPYPYATDNHQEKNADFVVEKIGGGLKLSEFALDAEKFAFEIRKMIGDDKKLLKTMQEALCQYKQKLKYKEASTLVCDLAGI